MLAARLVTTQEALMERVTSVRIVMVMDKLMLFGLLDLE